MLVNTSLTCADLSIGIVAFDTAGSHLARAYPVVKWGRCLGTDGVEWILGIESHNRCCIARIETPRTFIASSSTSRC